MASFSLGNEQGKTYTCPRKCWVFFGSSENVNSVPRCKHSARTSSTSPLARHTRICLPLNTRSRKEYSSRPIIMTNGQLLSPTPLKRSLPGKPWSKCQGWALHDIKDLISVCSKKYSTKSFGKIFRSNFVTAVMVAFSHNALGDFPPFSFQLAVYFRCCRLPLPKCDSPNFVTPLKIGSQPRFPYKVVSSLRKFMMSVISFVTKIAEHISAAPFVLMNMYAFSISVVTKRDSRHALKLILRYAMLFFSRSHTFRCCTYWENLTGLTAAAEAGTLCDSPAPETSCNLAAEGASGTFLSAVAAVGRFCGLTAEAAEAAEAASGTFCDFVFVDFDLCSRHL